MPCRSRATSNRSRLSHVAAVSDKRRGLAVCEAHAPQPAEIATGDESSHRDRHQRPQHERLDSVGIRIDAAGGPGNDTLDGGPGPDILDGGAGNDTLNGGGGADVLTDSSGTDTITYAGRGTGIVANLQTGANGDNDAYTGTFEVLTGTSFNDTLTAATATPTTLNGGAGEDTLNGGSQADTLNGGTDTDILNGSDGDDVLNGGTGASADQHNGGAGTDTADYSDFTTPVTASLATGIGQDGGHVQRHREPHGADRRTTRLPATATTTRSPATRARTR